MKPKIRKQLLKAAETISLENEYCICACIGSDWKQSEEAMMINPGHILWWGFNSMRVRANDDEARNARLLGIAFMLTMPKEIIQGKCHK
jgi:hypothetical protein